jgi:hypothetical protein
MDHKAVVQKAVTQDISESGAIEVSWRRKKAVLRRAHVLKLRVIEYQCGEGDGDTQYP